MPQTRINAEACPPELRQRRQWVLWRSELKKGRKKPTKIPYQLNGQLASSIDPSTWCSFEEAIAAHETQHPPCSGIGYVFSADDPYVGVDLDDCATEDAFDIDAVAWINQLDGYAEISPSGYGVKIWCKGKKDWSGCQREWQWRHNDVEGKVEVYDHGRFFTLTGAVLSRCEAIGPCGQAGLNAIRDAVWPTKAPTPRLTPPPPAINAASRCLAYIRTLPMAIDGQGGSIPTLQAACECFRFGLSDAEAMQIMRDWNQTHCDPQWSERELQHKVNSAKAKVAAEGGFGRHLSTAPATTPPPPPPSASPAPEAEPAESPFAPQFRPVSQLVVEHPELNPPIIEGLLREGETMNVIASPKMGKSWLVTDMAIAVAMGMPWMGKYHTHQGDVLILDNELHACTTANRVPKVAYARGLKIEDYGEHVFVDNLRGRLMDIRSLAHYIQTIEPGQFKLIILDAFYRFMPTGVDENANADIAQIYNAIDAYAHHLQCAFVLIHHTSKGNQSDRSVTDVGAGAGSQSRAADSHLILRPHDEDDVVVLDAAVRSWAPVEPQCLRWQFPLYDADDSLDPEALRKPKQGGKKSSQEWDAERFAEAFIGVAPDTRDDIIEKAQKLGLSQRRAKALLQQAEDRELIHRWRYAPQDAHKFSCIRQR